MLARKALAGTAAAPKVYVESVFSSYLYTGSGATKTITNDIDLSGEGGLVWIKDRNIGNHHNLVDTARGATKDLYTSLTSAEGTTTDGLTAFTSTGFTLGADAGGGDRVNKSGDNYVSWTFRKAEKFFDVVTYTGNGSNRTISHNLGSVPGCIIVKRTDTTGDWQVFHRSNTAAPETDYLVLNSTAATADSDTRWNDTLPTSTVFSLGTEATVNANGGTYVAYLFAHDAGGFGDAGTDNVISCGSFTTDGSNNATVSLGYEPQWIMIKRISGGTGNWDIFDSMRGMPATGLSPAYTGLQNLFANLSNAEGENNGPHPTATGFDVTSYGATNTPYIYIAIRRGPMKTPEAGTEVFTPVARTGTGATASISAGFAPDAIIETSRTKVDANTWVFDKLRGIPNGLRTNTTGADVTIYTDAVTAFTNDGVTVGADSNAIVNANTYTYINWMFRRAPGFFDVVATDVFNTGTNVNHNLGVTPELVIAKARNNSGGNWMGAFKDGTSVKNISLNVTTAAYDPSLTWSDYFTSTTFNPTGIKNAAGGGVYGTSSPTVIYLFASLSGVSKVGTYTGNGSSVTVTTNFQPRFILVKRTDSTGDWIVSDSARGLVAGNDPYLELNTTDAEVTNEDWVDITSTSFTVNQTTNNANVNTGTYIYLAIA